jgi:hypothetical protein
MEATGSAKRRLAFIGLHGIVFQKPRLIILWRIDSLLSGDSKQRPFLGNGSLNTFPPQRTRTEQQKNNVLYVIPAEMLEARDKVQLSSAREAVKKGL